MFLMNYQNYAQNFKIFSLKVEEVIKSRSEGCLDTKVARRVRFRNMNIVGIINMTIRI